MFVNFYRSTLSYALEFFLTFKLILNSPHHGFFRASFDGGCCCLRSSSKFHRSRARRCTEVEEEWRRVTRTRTSSSSCAPDRRSTRAEVITIASCPSRKRARWRATSITAFRWVCVSPPPIAHQISQGDKSKPAVAASDNRMHAFAFRFIYSRVLVRWMDGWDVLGLVYVVYLCAQIPPTSIRRSGTSLGPPRTYGADVTEIFSCCCDADRGRLGESRADADGLATGESRDRLLRSLQVEQLLQA